MSIVLGIDIGTSRLKITGLRSSGKIIYQDTIDIKTHHPKPGLAEQYPHEIFELFIHIITTAIKEINISDLEGICFSSAMHSLILLDENFNPITNNIIWSDSRSSEIAKTLRVDPVGARFYDLTGTPIHSMSPLTKILWHRENMPDVFKQVKMFVSLKDYILYQLFDQWKVDWSIASATGLFNIRNKEWETEVLEHVGISTLQLPEVVPPSYTFSGLSDKWSHKLKLPEDISWIIGGSDGFLSNLGAHAFNEGDVVITAGTSGAVRTFTFEPLKNTQMQLFNYTAEGSYLTGAPTNNMGNVIDWFIKTWIEDNNVTATFQDFIDLMKKSPSGSEKLIFLPYLFGERAPLWDENASAIFCSVENNHRKEHFARSVVEGLFFNLKIIYENMINSGLKESNLFVNGGLSKNIDLMQILSNILNKEFIVEDPDAASVGAAYFALKNLHLINDWDELIHKEHRIISPQTTESEKYDVIFQIFKSVLNEDIKNTRRF